MKRFLKAAALTAFAIGPLILLWLLPPLFAAAAIVGYLIGVMVGSDRLISHFERKRTIRDAELDALFDGVFSDYEADLSRFPFRTHVFIRCGSFPVEQLKMVYSYRTHSTDPDREIRFYRYFGGEGQGLVWQSCANGDVRYFRRDDVENTKSAFHLRGAQDTATRDVIAVLALPLRQLVGHDPASGRTRQLGVLTFDALSPDAADALGKLFVECRTGEQPALAELADRVSLYV